VNGYSSFKGKYNVKAAINGEMALKVAKLNCRIYEVGISYSGRTYQEGKKSAGETVSVLSVAL
jgi:hypothetical protein